MDDQSRNVDLLEILGEIGFRKSLNAIIDSLEPGLHPLKPERVAETLGDLRAWAVSAVEWHRETLEEL